MEVSCFFHENKFLGHPNIAGFHIQIPTLTSFTADFIQSAINHRFLMTYYSNFIINQRLSLQFGSHSFHHKYFSNLIYPKGVRLRFQQLITNPPYVSSVYFFWFFHRNFCVSLEYLYLFVIKYNSNQKSPQTTPH